MSNYKFLSSFDKALCLILHIFSNVLARGRYIKTIPPLIYYNGEDYRSIESKENGLYIYSYFKFENRTKLIYLMSVSSRYERLLCIKMCWKLLNNKNVKIYDTYNINSHNLFG